MSGWVRSASSNRGPFSASSKANAAAALVPTRFAVDSNSVTVLTRASCRSNVRYAPQPNNTPIPLVNIVSSSNFCRSDIPELVPIACISAGGRLAPLDNMARQGKQLRTEPQRSAAYRVQVHVKNQGAARHIQRDHSPSFQKVPVFSDGQRRGALHHLQDLVVVPGNRMADEQNLATRQGPLFLNPFHFFPMTMGRSASDHYPY